MQHITSYSFIDSFAINPIVTVLLLAGLFMVFSALYFAPTLIGFYRGHRNRWPIFGINLVFGMTGIVWVLLLIFALNKFDDPVQ